MKIEALHEFHLHQEAKEWADRFVPTAPRLELFGLITRQVLNLRQRKPRILELGVGPGYLAKYLLEQIHDISYIGIDASRPMLQIARERLSAQQDLIQLIEFDMLNKEWDLKLENPPHAIVSTWTLHDLYTPENIAHIYQQSYRLLARDGMLINGDFIKPEDSIIEYEGGRIKPTEHIQLLKQAGFRDVTCLAHFEKDVLNPTTANNYACFRAIK